MKPKSTLRRLLAIACSSLLAASSSHALDGTWNVAAAGVTSHNWTDGGMWASGQIATGADYTANFTGIDITGNKTVSLNGTNRTIGNITFTDDTTSSNKLVISGNTLTLERTPVGAVPVITVTNQEIEITSTLAGTDGLVKTGAGGLRLNGTTSLTGGITIKDGGIASQNANRFGTNLITLGDVANTGTSCSIQVTVTGPFSNNIDVRGTGTNLIQNYTTGSTWSGAINLGGNLTFNDRQNGTTANVISGVISGTGNFSFLNRDNTVTNVLTLSNANTFTGSTTITSGILSLTHLNSLQYSYMDTTASATGDANDGLRTNQTTLKLGGLSGNKDLTSIFTTTTGGYSSVSGITLEVATANNLTYSGAIAGTRNLTKTGAGTQVLSGSNGYTGTTTVSLGTLLTTKAAALPGYNLASKVSVANGATLAVNADAGGWTSGEIDTLLGATTGAFASGSKLGIDVTTGSFTYSTDIGTTQAAKGLVKSGAGTLVLDATNTYTGPTTVSAGTLLVNNLTGSGTGSGLVTVSSGATLGGSGTIAGNTTISGTLRPGNSPGTMTFEDTLTLAGTTVMEIDGGSGPGVPGGHDFVNLTGAGALTYGGTMVLDIGITFGAGIHTWDLFGFINETGNFSTITLADQYSGSLLDADTNGVWDLTSGDNTWTFAKSTGVLTLAAVPEAGTAGLLALGLLLLRRLRRR